jgi:hypothetical protein
MVLTGGGLTMNQLGEFIFFMYNKTEAKPPEGFIYLDEDNTNLNNDNFAVFYNPDNIHFIAVHKGTKSKSIYDIGNNIRNMFFIENEKFITKRNLTSKKGHIELKNFLIHLYKNKTQNKNTKLNNIIKYIDDIIKSIKNVKKNNYLIEYTVNSLLRNKLTTIGHSQGAVYAYLYGVQGFETIVFNPAPYKGCKPANTYIIRNKGDFVSYFAKFKDNDLKIKNSKFIINKYFNDTNLSRHSSKTLLNNFKIVGDPLLVNIDHAKTQKKRKKSYKTNRNRNRTNRNKLI